MIALNSFICGDCMEYLPGYPDCYFDLALVDPPYGIGINSSGRLKKYNNGKKTWDDSTPPDEYFRQLFRVSKNQVIWGGNYFRLPPTRCFLIWDKRQPENISFASCEYAWTSFDDVAKTFYLSPMNTGEYRLHPCQKPVALYDWILAKFGPKILAGGGRAKVIDTHVGSASSLISCHKNGFDYVGFEKDPYYYDLASRRLEEHKAQITIFDCGVPRD